MLSSTDWTAVVTTTLHDPGEDPVSGATVSGTWGNRGTTVFCTTDASGSSRFTRKLKVTTAAVSFTVAEVTATGFSCQPEGNHDPDGDSNGLTITIVQ